MIKARKQIDYLLKFEYYVWSNCIPENMIPECYDMEDRLEAFVAIGQRVNDLGYYD